MANYAHDRYFNNTLVVKNTPSKEKIGQLGPNATWGMHRRLKALMSSTQECDVCGSPCGADDVISLDSGDYYICSDNCADEAAETF